MEVRLDRISQSSFWATILANRPRMFDLPKLVDIVSAIGRTCNMKTKKT